jgi:hypothetical protein
VAHASAGRMRRENNFSPLHPSACVGDSKGDGAVIRIRHVPATVANPKRGASAHIGGWEEVAAGGTDRHLQLPRQAQQSRDSQHSGLQPGMPVEV